MIRLELCSRSATTSLSNLCRSIDFGSTFTLFDAVAVRRIGSVVKGSFGEIIVSDRLPATERSRLLLRRGRFFKPCVELGSDEVEGPRLKGIDSYFPDGGVK